MKGDRIIVVGAGAWGGWTALSLQQAGFEVTLVDKMGPGNAMSGSGGQTRIIRMAYGGHEVYTRMVDRAFSLWDAYCKEWGIELYHEMGSLWMFRGIAPRYASLSEPLMKSWGYELNQLSLPEVAEKYPQINLEGITSAYFEPKVGFLEASRSCGIVLDHFVNAGGNYIQAEVTSVEGKSSVERILLKDGQELQADHFVFACGPWMKQLFPALAPYVQITRQEVYHFETREDHIAGSLPIWLEFREGEEMYYGIPGAMEQGFKFAYDERTWALDPDKDHREITPAILSKMRGVMGNRFPALKEAEVLKHHTCVYENSPDGHFIMDDAPGKSNATILCGSSGHGFKMGPAMGEMMLNHLQGKESLPEEFALKRLFNLGQKKTQYEV